MLKTVVGYHNETLYMFPSDFLAAYYRYVAGSKPPMIAITKQVPVNFSYDTDVAVQIRGTYLDPLFENTCPHEGLNLIDMVTGERECVISVEGLPETHFATDEVCGVGSNVELSHGNEAGHVVCVYGSYPIF